MPHLSGSFCKVVSWILPSFQLPKWSKVHKKAPHRLRDGRRVHRPRIPRGRTRSHDRSPSASGRRRRAQQRNRPGVLILKVSHQKNRAMHGFLFFIRLLAPLSQIPRSASGSSQRFMSGQQRPGKRTLFLCRLAATTALKPRPHPRRSGLIALRSRGDIRPARG